MYYVLPCTFTVQAMEWDILAAWVVGFDLFSDNNVWLIQVRGGAGGRGLGYGV